MRLRKTRQHYVPSGAPSIQTYALISLIITSVVAQSSFYTPAGRWGSAYTTLSNSLYVHGGKTDPSNQFGYSSAPATNDLLVLDLSESFALSQTPWFLLSGSDLPDSSQGPALAFHTITAVTTDTILLFGGDAGPSLAIATNPDSAWIISTSAEPTSGSSPVVNTVTWTQEPQSWANEPIRRIYHAASGVKGTVWITGGQKDDGSGISFNETWVYTPAQPPSEPDSFTLVQPTPPSNALWDLVGHASVLLTDDRLLIFGGYCASKNELVSFGQLWMIDLALSGVGSSSEWLIVDIIGDFPQARRNFAFALLDGNKILIQGGADAYLQNVFSDGWILDLNLMSWSEQPNMATGLGPRYDHIAVGLGSEAMFAFGFGPTYPASPGPYIYDTNSGSFVGTFTPPPSSTLGNPPGYPNPTSSTISASKSQSLTSTSIGKSITTLTQSSKTLSTPSRSSSTTLPNGSITIIPLPTSPPSSPAGRNDRIIGIAVGTVLGCMALISTGLALLYALSRQRARAGWGAVAAGDDGETPGGGGERRDVLWGAGTDASADGVGGVPRADHEGDILAAGVVGAGTGTVGAYDEKEGRRKPPSAWAMANTASAENGIATPISRASNMSSKRSALASLGLGLGAFVAGRKASREGNISRWEKNGRNDDDDSPPLLPAAASRLHGAGPRRDMLADEDEREFEYPSYEHDRDHEFGIGPYIGRRPGMSRNASATSGRTGGSEGMGRGGAGIPWFTRTASGKSWTDIMNEGVESVRAIGRTFSAAGASGYGSGGAAGYAPGSTQEWWEKNIADVEHGDSDAALMSDDEIGRRTASVDAATAAGAGLNVGTLGAVTVHPAAHMRGGAPSDVVVMHSRGQSQTPSSYRNPFSDGEDLDRNPLFSYVSASTSSDPTPGPFVGANGVAATLPMAERMDAGSSTGPGTAAFGVGLASTSAPTRTLPRPGSSSTIASSNSPNNTMIPLAHGPRSDQSHGSQGTSSGSSTAGPARGSIDTLHSSAPSAPIRRSNSWWTRFSLTPLRPSNGSLEGVRSTSPGGAGGHASRRLSFRIPGTGGIAAGGGNSNGDPRYSIEFRDPNPPPIMSPAALLVTGGVSRLQVIEETGNTPDGSPDTPENSNESAGTGSSNAGAVDVAALGSARLGKRDSQGNRKANSVGHHAYGSRHSQNSTSSLGTTRTADSEMLEKMGAHYQLVQRTATPSHLDPSPSDIERTGTTSTTSTRHIDEPHDLGIDTQATDVPGDFGDRVTSPTVMDASLPALSGPRPLPPPGRPRLNLSSVDVQHRIATFERHAAIPTTPLPGGPRPPPPTETAAERREKRRRTALTLDDGLAPQLAPQSPSRARWTVAERAALFVANPDARHRDGTDNSQLPSA